jgi:hypothetical protein
VFTHSIITIFILNDMESFLKMIVIQLHGTLLSMKGPTEGWKTKKAGQTRPVSEGHSVSDAGWPGGCWPDPDWLVFCWPVPRRYALSQVIILSAARLLWARLFYTIQVLHLNPRGLVSLKEQVHDIDG